jgi:hypothetical protein
LGGDGLLLAIAANTDFYLFAWILIANHLSELLGAVDLTAVDGKDLIAALDAGPGGGAAAGDFADFNRAVGSVEHNAQTRRPTVVIAIVAPLLSAVGPGLAVAIRAVAIVTAATRTAALAPIVVLIVAAAITGIALGVSLVIGIVVLLPLGSVAIPLLFIVLILVLRIRA